MFLILCIISLIISAVCAWDYLRSDGYPVSLFANGLFIGIGSVLFIAWLIYG